LAFSRAISRSWSPGDEIVVTALDHDANIWPWVLAARDRDVKVNWVKFKTSDYTLDLDDLNRHLTERTRLVAVGCASNATGGVNPVKSIAALAHKVGALVYLDAVHFGPHGLINVADWNCDFLACSAYKFFGPHLGIMWGRRKLLESIEAYRVRPVGEELPGKWMTGTQSHEAIIGGLACVDYLANLGRQLAGDPELPRRAALESAFLGIGSYEQDLSKRLLTGLRHIDGIKVWGISDLERLDERFPTVSITHDKIATTRLAGELATLGINVWQGHYYALEFVERLGLLPEGMVRIGLVHYNTPDEIERLLSAIESIVSCD
jgi:cysteine desulfurase family protein (TIGR01976 family)